MSHLSPQTSTEKAPFKTCQICHRLEKLAANGREYVEMGENVKECASVITIVSQIDELGLPPCLNV